MIWSKSLRVSGMNSQSLKVAKGNLSQNHVPQWKEDRSRQGLSPNISQLVFSPEVSEFNYSLLATFL